jgi:membrane-bound lytic murein transglycosylase D
MTAASLTAAETADAPAERPRLPAAAGRPYVVKAGDTLGSVARTQKIAPSDLADFNGLEPGEALLPGQNLRIPTASGGEDLVTHRVQKGDSLDAIARRYGVSVTDLLRWNPVAATEFRRGNLIRIYRRGAESA